MTSDDQDLLRLLIKDAVRDGMDDHLKNCHEKLNDKVDETRRFMWFGMGGSAALGGILGKLIGH